MKRAIAYSIFIISFLASVFACGAYPGPTSASKAEENAKRSSRLDWWREARFGMFIHWGIYAVPAQGEWYMTDAHVPMKQYEKYASQFDPTSFDAESWVKIAHDAGMKYLVITSKHHDGFSMFRTAATKYNVVDDTPWGKDPLLALSKACRRYGVRFCVYYSIMDWHSPFQEADKPDSLHPTYNPTHFRPGEKDAYIAYMKTQLKELVRQYHPSVLWFDGGWMNGWNENDGKSLYAFLRKLDPKLIINNRVIGAGDYETPEQEIPPNGIPGHDWETCMTINNSWGFNSSDLDFKSDRDLLFNLVDIASKGGNYLLNVGPTDSGIIPAPEVTRLETMGKWLKTNGDAIYGTTASPFATQLAWGRCTAKKNFLYLSVFEWPSDRHLVVHGLHSKPENAYLLGDRHRKPLEVSKSGDSTIIMLPPNAPDSIASVVVLKFAAKPVVYNPPLIIADEDIFVDTLVVNILSAEGNGDVRYTTDGTEPSLSSTLSNGPITISDGTTIRAARFLNGEQVSETSSRTFRKVEALPGTEPGQVSSGIAYAYFEGRWDSLPDFSKLSAIRTGTMTTFGIPPQASAENFGVVYSCYFNAPAKGVYTFYTGSDDGSKLYIDERLVVDNNGLHGTVEKSGVIALSPGYHSMRVEFFQASGGKEIYVSLKGPGLAKEKIPASLIFTKQ